MKITNQKPQVLSPVYDAKAKGDFDPVAAMKAAVIEPLYTPLVGTAPASFTANGKSINADELTQMLCDCLGDTYNATAEAAMRDVLHQTLLNYDTANVLGAKELFAAQSGAAAHMPAPTPNTIYTPATDIIPTCKMYLAGQATYDQLFASFDYYTRAETLGVAVTNEKAFDAFKAWLANEVAQISSVLDPQVNQLFSQFQQLTLSQLTESLILRNDDGDNNEEFSFARTLIAYVMMYAKQNAGTFDILPFDLGELFCPRTIVFVNIEAHAHATPKKVSDEWNIIKKSLSMKVNIVSNRSLAKLTGAARTLKKIKSNAAYAAAQGRGMGIQRAARAAFRPTALTTVDMTKLVKRVINKMATVNMSENSYKSVKMSFARPNRRDPDNFNLQGKVVSTKYKPDIHLYIDTSGSISERNYQDAVRACINMAKKLNVNLYFNSFSHVISQCTHLRTKDKSVREVYRQFQRVPKVTGGTDYEQVWNYIQRDKKRRRELSIIMTDFEYNAPNHAVVHPKNLYYIPCSQMDWDYIKDCAQSFCDSMQRIDPNIRRKLLF